MSEWIELRLKINEYRIKQYKEAIQRMRDYQIQNAFIRNQLIRFGIDIPKSESYDVPPVQWICSNCKTEKLQLHSEIQGLLWCKICCEADVEPKKPKKIKMHMKPGVFTMPQVYENIDKLEKERMQLFSLIEKEEEVNNKGSEEQYPCQHGIAH
jgi:hypothetical protein